MGQNLPAFLASLFRVPVKFIMDCSTGLSLQAQEMGSGLKNKAKKAKMLVLTLFSPLSVHYILLFYIILRLFPVCTIFFYI